MTKLQELKWKLHCYKYKKLLLYGLSHGLIIPYNNELIEKLRKIYYGGMPASIILLSDVMSNGHCYDRALLISQAFLDSDDDVQLLYATIDSLKLNPKYITDDYLYASHCICERITRKGQHIIYDTTSGFIYDKKMYWLMENPKVYKINNKESIKQFIKDDEERYPEDVNRGKYAAPLILSMLEMSFGRPNEMYSLNGIELLQREIEHYKEQIKYDDVVREIDKDMKKLGLKK